MELFYRKYGETGKPLMIFHGLFGMSDNWHNVSQQLAASYTVYNTELRNHGQSPHDDLMNYNVMANDIVDTMMALQLDKAYILGHSMGGKVAMNFALRYPEKAEKLVVVDIAPRQYKRGHDDIFDAIIPMRLADYKTRGEIDAYLTPLIPEFTTRQFILKNLGRSENGGFYWKMNIEAIYKNYEAIIGPVESDKSYDKPTLFIRGEHSKYIQDNDWDSIEKLFPNSELLTIPGAGHWVHADKPAELVAAVSDFLTK